MWASFFLLLLSIVIYSAGILVLSPRNATLVPLMVGVVLPCGPCMHCARSSGSAFFGLYSEDAGTWEWVEPRGYQGRDPDIEIHLRLHNAPMGLWAPCASRQWASILVQDFASGVVSLGADSFDENAAESALSWLEGVETSQFGLPIARAVDAAWMDTRSGSRAMLLSTTGTLSGWSTPELSLAGVAHDAVMTMITSVCGWLGVVSLWRAPAWRREKAWRAKSCCGSCGYDLTGLRDRTCPECGRDNNTSGDGLAG
jgi:hypothetical protein